MSDGMEMKVYDNGRLDRAPQMIRFLIKIHNAGRLGN
jgi:hypothetical protein